MIKFSNHTIGLNGKSNHPTVFMFHGWGANMYDLLGLSPYFPSTWNWRFIQGPVNLGQQSYGWFPKDLSIFKTLDPQSYFLNLPDSFQEELNEIKNYLFDQIQTLPPIEGPIIVGGFSQGAMISLACLFEFDLFPSLDGVLALSPTSWKSLEHKILKRRAGNDLPIFISHGYQDPILPYEKTEQLIEKMKLTMDHIYFNPFQGGHEIPDSTMIKIAKSLRELIVH